MERILIPTRFNQQYKGGTVVGFDSSTGSVIIFSNNCVNDLSATLLSFEQAQLDTLRDYPKGYKWPSVQTFNCVLESGRVVTPTAINSVTREFSTYLIKMFRDFDCISLLTSNYTNYGIVDVKFLKGNDTSVWCTLSSIDSIEPSVNFEVVIPVYEFNDNTRDTE